MREALHELRLAWSSGDAGAATGPRHWPELVERRKSIHEAQRRWVPPVAVGATPEAIDDPVTIMLFGVTPERVQGWLASAGDPGATTLSGIAASPGVAEGKARLVADAKQLAQVEDGEILVAASTSPSWTPVFGRVSAVVVDIGGIMCHAAIVAREYGLPTVVGTGSATKTIRTGDRIRVDGHSGVVTDPRLSLHTRQATSSKTTSEAPKLWRHSQFSFGLSSRSVASGRQSQPRRVE